ncbi:hypothetical protein KPH14_004396 [Odynerus spinipes]|uniref:Uncharacterized protein n=1 Tax=Odynerus spinipes TaxID=1348599 RepID=A0AAD9RZE4_9HYME|nr:hypothetical protein KPH14_004396 [Odynerus spinipes]
MEQSPAGGSEDRRKRLSTITEYSESAFDSDDGVSPAATEPDASIAFMKMETEREINEHILVNDPNFGCCVGWSGRKVSTRF